MERVDEEKNKSHYFSLTNGFAFKSELWINQDKFNNHVRQRRLIRHLAHHIAKFCKFFNLICDLRTLPLSL